MNRTQASANCDCGFSAEVCKTNPCMRKKMATSGLVPEAKYPYCGTDSVVQASPTSAEKEVFAAATKIDVADAVKHLRNWVSYIDDHHRQKYADLMEAQAKLIAWLIEQRRSP